MNASAADCFACRVGREYLDTADAFLAGMAFAASYNTEAIRQRLCSYHEGKLKAGYGRAMGSVPAEARR